MNNPRIRAILVGGLAAGLFDILFAMHSWSWRVPRAIAAGLLGPEALKSESMGIWTLGLALHFFITCVAATIYYAASRRLVFLRQHWLICGLFFGIAVWLVMNLVVLPLSALHNTGPYTWKGMTQGLLVHMFLVGVPIAWSVKKFSPP